MMASISWYWFIVIGVAVTVISLFSEKLMLFLVPGTFFIIWGLGKFAVKLKTSKKKQQVKQQAAQYNHTDEERQYHHDLHMHKNNARPVVHYKLCPQCRMKLRLQDNFCSRCGTPLPRQPGHHQHQA